MSAHKKLVASLAYAFIFLITIPGFAKEQTLLSFNGSDGQYPYAGVILDKAGNLYGTTAFGGAYGLGVAYELKYSNGSWNQTILYNFGSIANDGTFPECNLIFDKSGNLFGTTLSGGTNEAGTVFELTNNAGNWSENILYNFKGGTQDGNAPAAGVVFDKNGDLLGTAELGGKYDSGIVFGLRRVNGMWRERILHTFTGGTDGSLPQAGVTLDAQGNIYGTTMNGGAYAGVVYRLAHDTYAETVLHEFEKQKNDGAYPSGSVTFDAAWNLYGTASVGGALGWGNVFELSPTRQGVKYSVLYNFSGGVDGAEPLTGVTLDSSGNIYGTTFQGGEFGAGDIFELKKSQSGYTLINLYSFTGGPDGGDPTSGELLALSPSGILFGTSNGSQTQSLGAVVAVKP